MMAACAARFDPAVEAVILRTYGLDTLADPISPRRMIALLRGLPSGSLEAWTDNAAAWSTEAHLLAHLVDAVQWNTWTLARVNSKSKPKEPKPTPRPGPKPKRRTTSIQALAGLLGAVEGVEHVGGR